jgi:hypothetical protein
MMIIVIGNCLVCKRMFGFNPHHVPSIRINGQREPVCRACIEQANPRRIRSGLAPVEIHPEAYEAAEEL